MEVVRLHASLTGSHAEEADAMLREERAAVVLRRQLTDEATCGAVGGAERPGSATVTRDLEKVMGGDGRWWEVVGGDER